MTARLEHPMSAQERGRRGAEVMDEYMKERSRRLIAAAREQAPEIVRDFAVTPSRAEQLQSAWRDQTALWIATHPKGEEAALVELSEVFSDE